MPNIELHPPKEVSMFRKIAIGTWRTAFDPSVYGTLTLPMDAATQYIAEFREKTGRRLTISHMMAKAAAACFERMPDANAILRFNRPYQRKTIGVFFQVAMTDEGEDKIDLSGATIYDVEKKSLMEIYEEFNEKVERVRQRKDPALEKTRSSFRLIPFLFLNAFLNVISFLTYTLNLDLRWAGLPKDPFGSVMITNIGSLGLEEAYVPLVPYSRCPMLLATGAIKEVPVVEDGEVVIRKQMRVHATFDHRFIDGFHAAIMSKVLLKWFGDPYTYFGSIDELAAAESEAVASEESANEKVATTGK